MIMGEVIDDYADSLLERANANYYHREQIAEMANQRRDNARTPVIRAVLSGIALFRERQLSVAAHNVSRATDYHYRAVKRLSVW
jgi:hypothetical protein